MDERQDYTVQVTLPSAEPKTLKLLGIEMWGETVVLKCPGDIVGCGLSGHLSEPVFGRRATWKLGHPLTEAQRASLAEIESLSKGCTCELGLAVRLADDFYKFQRQQEEEMRQGQEFQRKVSEILQRVNAALKPFEAIIEVKRTSWQRRLWQRIVSIRIKGGVTW